MMRIIKASEGGPALQVRDHWVAIHRRRVDGWRWWWQAKGVQWPFMHVASQRMRRTRSWALGRWEVVVIPMREGW